jgi:hypothetical protein
MGISLRSSFLIRPIPLNHSTLDVQRSMFEVRFDEARNREALLSGARKSGMEVGHAIPPDTWTLGPQTAFCL